MSSLLKTYTIKQWGEFLADVKGKKLRVNALIGNRIELIDVTRESLRDLLSNDNSLKSITVDIMSSCAFVEYSVDKYRF